MKARPSLPEAQMCPPGPAHPLSHHLLRGTGTPIPPRVHPARHSQGASSWTGRVSPQQMLWLLLALPQAEIPVQRYQCGQSWSQVTPLLF